MQLSFCFICILVVLIGNKIFQSNNIYICILYTILYDVVWYNVNSVQDTSHRCIMLFLLAYQWHGHKVSFLNLNICNCNRAIMQSDGWTGELSPTRPTEPQPPLARYGFLLCWSRHARTHAIAITLIRKERSPLMMS